MKEIGDDSAVQSSELQGLTDSFQSCRWM